MASRGDQQHDSSKQEPRGQQASGGAQGSTQQSGTQQGGAQQSGAQQSGTQQGGTQQGGTQQRSTQRPSDVEQPIAVSGERGMSRTQGRGMQRGAGLGVGRILSPWDLMRRMTAELDRLVTADAGTTATTRRNASGAATRDDADDLLRADWVPRLEIVQRDNAIVARVELAGLTPDEVDVSVQDGMLTISGERKIENREQDQGVMRTERAYGTFFRAIPLPEGADEDNISATFRDGVLELNIPISEPARGRRIDVRS
jgi:HSP20 family protein